VLHLGRHGIPLLVRKEVSLANLGAFAVDKLAATGIGEAAACELLSQFKFRSMAASIDDDHHTDAGH
jgi:hypothetical protein